MTESVNLSTKPGQPQLEGRTGVEDPRSGLDAPVDGVVPLGKALIGPRASSPMDTLTRLSGC